jgi:hypothetical protein
MFVIFNILSFFTQTRHSVILRFKNDLNTTSTFFLDVIPHKTSGRYYRSHLKSSHGRHVGFIDGRKLKSMEVGLMSIV